VDLFSDRERRRKGEGHFRNYEILCMHAWHGMAWMHACMGDMGGCMDNMGGCMHGWICFLTRKDKGIRNYETLCMHACTGGWMAWMYACMDGLRYDACVGGFVF
jgi:hypothetical protein